MSELLNELLTRVYSDEGTPIGVVSAAEWIDGADDFITWANRAN